MGHCLLNWYSYVHRKFQPVSYNQATHINFIFLMFLTNTSELIPFMWILWLLLGVLGSFIYFISNTRPIILKHLLRPCPNCKRLKRWSRHKLHYWLVCRCRRQPRHRPTCLGGSLLPQQQFTKYKIWRRGRACDRAFFKRLRMDEFLSGRKDGYHPQESEGVSKTARDSFCDNKN